MGVQELLDTPISMFWALSKYIDRLRAEEDLRVISTHSAILSEESYTTKVDQLTKQAGEVAIFDKAETAMSETLDREGLAALKELGRTF